MSNCRPLVRFSINRFDSLLCICACAIVGIGVSDRSRSSSDDPSTWVTVLTDDKLSESDKYPVNQSNVATLNDDTNGLICDSKCVHKRGKYRDFTKPKKVTRFRFVHRNIRVKRDFRWICSNRELLG